MQLLKLSLMNTTWRTASRFEINVLDFFKASGKGYQTRINAVLRHFMQEARKNKKAG